MAKSKAKSISFEKQFSALLKEIPKESTLPQWQYLYRHVIISMGMKILHKFPEKPPRASQPKGGLSAGPQPPPPPPPPLHGISGPHDDTGKGGPTGGPQPAVSVAKAALGLRAVGGGAAGGQQG